MGRARNPTLGCAAAAELGDTAATGVEPATARSVGSASARGTSAAGSTRAVTCPATRPAPVGRAVGRPRAPTRATATAGTGNPAAGRSSG